MMSMCIFPSGRKKVGVSPGGVTCAEAKRQKMQMQQYSKKKRPYDTMDAAKAKGSPKTRPCFLLVAPQPTVRTTSSSRKSRYLLQDGVWRGLQVFLSSTGACRTTRFGSYASSAHPQFMRTPLFGEVWSQGQNSALHSTAQAMLGSTSLLFHLPSGPLRGSTDDRQRAFPRAAAMAAVVAERQ